jgi:formylglycine-generating enzyme required for sulfatase activity
MIRVRRYLALAIVLLAVVAVWVFAVPLGCRTSTPSEDVGHIQVKEAGPYYTDWPFDEAEAKRRQKLTAEKLGLPLKYELDLGNGLKMAFLLIPAGEFMMGSPADEPGRSDNEGPVHRVSISKPFCMGKHEVTQA